jgi:Zn-finger nucleic acid-binding protein
VHACDVCGGIYAPARGWCLLAEEPDVAARIRARMQEPKMARRALLDFLRCPGCGGQMERGRFAATTDIVVDVCALHGIWLDAGDLDALVNVTSEPERQRLIDEQMESLARQQQVTYAISSESHRIRGESLQRMYSWKVALAVGVVLVLAMLGLASAKREVHDQAEHPRAAVAVAPSPPPTPAPKSRSRSAER